MQGARSFFTKIALALVVTLVLTPVAGMLLPPIRWHRIPTRIFMVMAILLFVAGAGHPRGWIDRLRAMGLRGPYRGLHFGAGALGAIALFVLIIGGSYLAGVRVFVTEEPKHSMTYAFLVFTFVALLVGFLEELVFRGYMKDVLGGLASAALYAVVHFFKPVHGTRPFDGFEPFIVFERIGDIMEGWTNFQNMTWGILTLFMFGLALNRFRERTGSLYVGIGLHAGVVFSMKIYMQWFDGNPVGSKMIWGSRRIHDGFIGFLAMALILAVAYWAPLGARFRKNETPAPESPAAPAA